MNTDSLDKIKRDLYMGDHLLQVKVATCIYIFANYQIIDKLIVFFFLPGCLLFIPEGINGRRHQLVDSLRIRLDDLTSFL